MGRGQVWWNFRTEAWDDGPAGDARSYEDYLPRLSHAGLEYLVINLYRAHIANGEEPIEAYVKTLEHYTEDR